eukprot:scaffold5532_cov180-Amphora_coffeaeformis.AAC.9
MPSWLQAWLSTKTLTISSSSMTTSSLSSSSQAYETIQDADVVANGVTNNNNNNNNNNASSSHTNEVQSPSPPASLLANTKLVQLVLVAAATAATLGYDVGIMAAAIQPLEREMNLTAIQKEVAMGSLNFVAAAGALVGGRVANARGRQPTVRVCSWLFVVGTVCMAAAPNYAVLVLGRIITGLGVGVSFVVAPVYLSEVAPTAVRGQLNTVFDVAINGGILLGYVLGFLVQVTLSTVETADNAALVNSLKWRLMLGLGLILPAVVLANLKALPESPRWLVMRQDTAGASTVLHKLGENPRQILRTISSIQEELDTDEGMGTQAASLCKNWSHGMWLAVALGFWQQITGTEAVLYYSADFLEHAGLQSATQRLLGNCFVGLCKLTPELFAMQVVDSVGRRPLMLGSAVALMISTATLALAFAQSWSPMSVVILLCAVMASFSIGLGPFSFLVASENLGLSERATGVTLCAAANRCTSGTVALTAVSLYQAVGPAGLFALYAVIGAASLCFYVPCLKETSGQTLEELAAARNNSNRRAVPTNVPEIAATHEPVFSDTPEVEVPGGTMA